MPLRGESVGTAYVRILADGTGFPASLHKEFDRADGDFDKGAKQGADRYKETFRSEMEKHDGHSLSDALFDSLAKNDFNRKFFKSQNWHDFETRLKAGFGKAGQNAADELRAKFLKKGDLEGIEREVHKMVTGLEHDSKKGEHAMIRLAQATDTFGLAIGRAFGKGSRNNFLNFFGSFVTNAFKFIGLFPRMLGNLGELKTGFNEARDAGKGLFDATKAGFTNMANDAEGAQTALGGLFASGPVGFAAFAGALLLVIPLLGVVASLASGVAAAVIAMASTISFAIVGAFVPLLGILGPIGLALAGIVLAFSTLGSSGSTRMKALGALIKPVVTQLKALGEEVRSGFGEAFVGGMGRAADAVKQFGVVFHAVGIGLGQSANIFVRAFNSPEFSQFKDALGTFFPEAMRRLSRIAVDVGDALGSIFIDSIPFARRFLHGLEQITEKFADFLRANPDKVQHFFRQAEISARHFWDLLKEVSAVLADLLFSTSAKQAGDDIFQSLTKSLKKFDAFISPKKLNKPLFDETASKIGHAASRQVTGPSPLDGFFKNGKEVADAIGNIAVQFGKMFDQVDNPDSRKNLASVLSLLIGLSKLGNIVINVSINFPVLSTLLLGLENLPSLLDGARKKIGDFFGFLKKGSGFGGGGKGLQLIKPAAFTSWIPGALGRIQGFVDRSRAFIISIATAPAVVGRAIISTFANAMARSETAIGHGVANVVRSLLSIPGRIGGIASRLGQLAVSWADNIFNAFVNLPRDIANLFVGLGQRIANAIGDINIHIKTPSSILGVPIPHVDTHISPPGGSGGGGSSTGSATPQSSGKTINNVWNIVTPATDPAAAANELLNRMVASAY